LKRKEQIYAKKRRRMEEERKRKGKEERKRKGRGKGNDKEKERQRKRKGKDKDKERDYLLSGTTFEQMGIAKVSLGVLLIPPLAGMQFYAKQLQM
jgi:hypothetical protein